MGRHTSPVCKLCRREGNKLFLKGDKCSTEKCPVKRRAYPPGQHGQTPTKSSEYSIRLREKQKARRIYGISERQFKSYFEKALKWKGVTGEKLLELLERRMDNVVYRMGFAPSRAEARQLVTHGHILLNNKKVNIPSLSVKKEDVLKVKDGISAKVRAYIEKSGEKKLPNWLSMNASSLEGKIESIPERKEIGEPINESMIVEFYSR